MLAELGMPRAQQNDRSALCLLALLNLTSAKKWAKAENPLVGITPMMEFARNHYGKQYAPNSRETFRRQTVHQFVAAGVALYNPDNPARAVNSPKAVYQIEPDTVDMIRKFGSAQWNKALQDYLAKRETLAARYARRSRRDLDLRRGHRGEVGLLR